MNEVFERFVGIYLYFGEWYIYLEDRLFFFVIDRYFWRRNIVFDEFMFLLIVGCKDFWFGKKERELIIVFKKIEF